MYAWRVPHIRSVPLREFSFLRAPSGPLIPFGDMGTLWAPTFQKIKSINSCHVALHQQPGDHMLVEREVGGHDVATMPPADTPAHFGRGTH